jgi:hypothetical protein
MSTHSADRNLVATPEFARYQSELAIWLHGDAGNEDALVTTGAALCQRARLLGIRSEQLVILVRNGRRSPAVIEGTDRLARASQERTHRDTIAMSLLLTHYFEPGSLPSDGATG